MDQRILSKNVQRFITSNLTSDISKLALTKNPFPEIDYKVILNQIVAKSKAKEKLPTWFNCDDIYYPEKLSIEQTSSEITAGFKSNLVSGRSLIDLSGGFGVDDYYFSKKIENVAHCEYDIDLSAIVCHNFQVMKIDNISTYAGDSLEILKNLNQKWDWIYVDPARRHNHKGKVFMMSDCIPNVPELLPTYFNYSDNILMKTAPLLDISAGLRELPNVKSIHVVAVNNEVKELLWTLSKSFNGDPIITCVNITQDESERLVFNPSTVGISKYSLPKKYVYEPNAAIMKAGAFAAISEIFGIEKLHQHSHLFTSDELIDFPGRRFLVENIVEYNKAEMKLFSKQRMNVTTRNFPETVEEIRKKWKILDGGKCYSFFTTDIDNRKIVLLCTKIQP
ncbi:MAG: class I SAM-dependent methyltransferase [Flavobacterium sp.]|nr:class I SAM-dependent methyltransferase [Flavobacterium sp.]